MPFITNVDKLRTLYMNGIKLIVGLGNHGTQYENTRHNVGFRFVTSLSEQYKAEFKIEPKFKGLISHININDHKCELLLPTTFMNLSGDAVRRIVNFYKLPVASLLVVHDELDFLPGVVRLKKGGSANGHNGVQNIIDQLGDNNFWRLRIGIGRPIGNTTVSDYVLSVPNKADRQEVYIAIDRALTVVPKLVLGDFEKTMAELHVV